MAGQELVAMDSHVAQGITFNEAVSWRVTCKDQSEVDRYWAALSESGEQGPCGWLKDRFRAVLVDRPQQHRGVDGQQGQRRARPRLQRPCSGCRSSTSPPCRQLSTRRGRAQAPGMVERQPSGPLPVRPISAEVNGVQDAPHRSSSYAAHPSTASPPPQPEEKAGQQRCGGIALC
ncbi:MAG: VOC family protein [Deltaproteobacteria bacterium]|nr:VOC family protein [Deltaproteobacteria bacterium]